MTDKYDSDIDINLQEEYEEPSLEDFRDEEENEEELIKEKRKKPLIGKMVVFVLVISLLSSILGVWVKVFNLPSIDFLSKSSELSKDEHIREYKKAIVLIEGNHIKGTGFNIAKDGKIITNYHIVETMNHIIVSFPDGQLFKGKVVNTNKEADIALLEIEGSNLPYLTLADQNEWEVDDLVFVIGNPLAYSNIAIEGYMLESDDNKVMRIDAPIHKGNSGSPVINEKGEVIGVIYAKTIPTVGKNEKAEGLAVPIHLVHQLIKE